MAELELDKLAVTPDSNIVNVLANYQNYEHLQNYLDYSSGTIWVMFIVFIYLKNATNFMSAQLAIVVPMVTSFILSFV